MRFTQERRVTAIALAVMAAAVLVFFNQVIFGDRVLLDPSPFRYDPWRSYAQPQDLESKMHQGDNLRSYLPRQYDLWRSLHSGTVPTWNPYVFGGAPFLADPQTRVFYPVSVLLALAKPTRAMGYDVATHIFIAMLGMYLFLRAVGGTVPGALVGAIGYGFSSFFFTRFGHPTFVASAAWIPYFFYAFEKAQSAERRGTVMLAVFLALGFLGGFPQVFMFGVAAFVIYAVYMTAHEAARRRWSGARRNVRIVAAGGVLSLVLVGVTLIPFVELLKNSTGLGIQFEEMKRLYLTSPILLVKSVFPDFFGNAVDRTDWRIVFGQTQSIHVSLFAVYCGVGGLLAALVGLVFADKSRRVGIFVILIAISVAMAVSPSMLKLVYRFRLATYSKIDRMAVVSCLSLAAIAGMGFSALSTEVAARRKKYVMAVLIAFVAAVTGAMLYFDSHGPRLLEEAARRFQALPEGLRLHPWNQMRSSKVFDWVLDPAGKWFAFEKEQIVRGLLFAVAGGVLLSLYLFVRARRFRVLVGVLFVAALILDCGWIAKAYFVNQPGYSFFETEGIKALREAEGTSGRWRIQCVSSSDTKSYPYETDVLPPNINQIFGIASLQGTYTTLPAQHAAFRELKRSTVPRPMERRGRPDDFPPANMPLASLMSVRHLLENLSSPVRSPSPVFTKLGRDEELGPDVRLMRLADDTRLALVLPASRAVAFGVDPEGASRIDLSFGFSAGSAGWTGGSDSVEAVAVCEGRGASAVARKRLSLARDAEVWHAMRLDLGSLGPGPIRISLTVSPLPLAGRVAGEVSGGAAALPESLKTGWSGFDLVSRDCDLRRSEDGYEVSVGNASDALSLRVTGSSPEASLEFTVGGDLKALQWVAFSDGMRSRQVLVDPEDFAGRIVSIKPRGDLRIEEAKMCKAVGDHVGYDLVYDGDMRIYENFGAVEKGVCLNRAAVSSDRKGVLQFASLDFAPARCGTSRIDAYNPGAVEMEVTADRDCYLLFQDTNYPGWRAYVDGKRVQIVPTDLGSRAVALSAGHHSVAFKFRPASFYVGILCTVAGVIVAAVAAVLPTRISLLSRGRRGCGSHGSPRSPADRAP